MGEILRAALSIGLLGLLLGGMLALASRFFAVQIDERIEKIDEILPGANCGGCGFAGCSAYAEAIVNQGAKTNCCTVGGDAVARDAAGIMGVDAEEALRRCSKVMCSGSFSKAHQKYQYRGTMDCHAAMRLGGGSKTCPYACIGYGSCMQHCVFGAISMVDGVAVIDREKCRDCGACISACPKHLIQHIKYGGVYWVACSSRDKGADVRKFCDAGCIGCKLCEKVCPTGAISVNENIAHIDDVKCTGCGLCAEVCPRKIITTGVSKKPTLEPQPALPVS